MSSGAPPDMGRHKPSDLSLMMTLSCILRLNEPTTALCLLYYHKFQQWQEERSLTVLDPDTLSLAAISLASKTLERPRRLREVLVPAYQLLQPDKAKLVFPSKLYDSLRAGLVNAELLLLRVIKFETLMPTPFECVEDLIRSYLVYSRSDSSHWDDYVAINDSVLAQSTKGVVLRGLMRRKVALFFTAKTIACAALITASHQLCLVPFGVIDDTDDKLDKWIVEDAREDVMDIQDCISELESAYEV